MRGVFSVLLLSIIVLGAISMLILLLQLAGIIDLTPQ